MSGTTSQRWIKVQVRVPDHIRVAVRECVERFLECPPREFREFGDPLLLVSGVVSEDATLSFRLKRLDEALRQIEQSEGLFEPLTVDLEAVDHPQGGAAQQGGVIYAGRRLIICSRSSCVRTGSTTGKSVLYIKPLQAFGDGRHPSTVLALRLLESLLEDGGGHAPTRGRVLDAGCGTGILSLAAAALGDFQVFGVDVSEDAIMAAKINQRHNSGAGRRVRFVRGGFSCARGPFCMVMANLVASVHTGAFEALWDSTAPGGRLILSGFSPGQKDLVTGPYLEKGAREIASSRERGWAGLILCRPAAWA